MAETTQFTIGVEAVCRDGDCGKVIRVVLDPVAQAVTHLVVEPKHRQGLGRLVPLAFVDAAGDEVRLSCTLEEFERLDAAEETHFLPVAGMVAGYGTGQVLSLPYYGLGVSNAPLPIVEDALPLGEVAVRRGERVHATDGEIGKVEGLVIDPRTHHVTHVLLQEGHLWGRKEVAIPIRDVAGIEDGIHLKVTKQQVQDLEPVDIDHLNP